MNREQLAAYSQRTLRLQRRGVFLYLAFVLLWALGLFLLARLGWVGDDSRSILMISAFGAVPVIIALSLFFVLLRKMPRCPHCGIRLYAPLLATAIATGNCGHCGKSIET